MSAVCSACGFSDVQHLYRVRDFEYLQCAHCGSAQLDGAPVAPANLYTRDYFLAGGGGGYQNYDRDAPIHRWTARRRLARLGKRIPPGEVRMLDIGCATGYVLEAAQALGWRAVGVDVSDYARDQAHARGLAAEATVADGIRHLGGPPTVVTCFQVLEHLADPLTALTEVTAAATPTAVVAIETWDLGSWTARLFGARWQQANPPSVRHLFTRRGLALMASRSGLVPLSIRIAPKPVSLGLLAGVASQAWPAVGAPVERLVTHLGVDTAPIPYVLDDLVALLACKPLGTSLATG